jgi:hypothetical protein
MPCWGGVVMWVCSWLYPNSEADFSTPAASAPPPLEMTESCEDADSTSGAQKRGARIAASQCYFGLVFQL